MSQPKLTPPRPPVSTSTSSFSPSSNDLDPPLTDGSLYHANPSAPSIQSRDARKVLVEESPEERIERLGRERPPSFKSLWYEIGLVFSIAMSQSLTEFFVSGFVVILPTLIKELDIPQASSVWPATAFSLVIASTLLIFGRLGDMWGAYSVFMIGLAWL
ncbi:hypothetical protein KCU65_g9824, partial [Aureobasidium melanogenum]